MRESKQGSFPFLPFSCVLRVRAVVMSSCKKKKEEESIKLNITRGTTTTHSRIYGAFLSFPPFLFCVWVGDHMGEEKGGRDQRREGPPRVKKKFPSSFPAATAAAASLPEKKRQKGRNKLLAFQIRESCCSFPSRVCSMGARKGGLCLINIFKRRWKAAAVKKRGGDTRTLLSLTPSRYISFRSAFELGRSSIGNRIWCFWRRF